MPLPKTPAKRPRATPFEPFYPPWATAAPIPYSALLEALRKPAAAHGHTRLITGLTAITYAQHLRGLIPAAVDAAHLAAAFSACTPAGLEPTRHLISSRKSAWLRFLTTKDRTPWETYRWPALPAAAKREGPQGRRHTFKNWWTPRTLGIGIKWLCARAKMHGVPMGPRDLRLATAGGLLTRPDGSRVLHIPRDPTIHTKKGKRFRGEPEITLPVTRADLFVIAAMLHASWGDNPAKVAADQRLLIARLGVNVDAEKIGELCNRAGTRLFEATSLCGGAARADAVDYVTEASGLTVMPEPGTPLDLWGSALASVLARIAIRPEVLPGVVGGHAQVLRFDGKRGLAILQAFELVDRVTLGDRAPAQVDAPLDPTVVEDAVAGANEVIDGVGAKRHRALRERVNTWRREREMGPKNGLAVMARGDAVDEVDEMPVPVVDPATLPAPVTPPPSPPAVVSDAARSKFLADLIAKRNEPYIPFSKEEKGKVR